MRRRLSMAWAVVAVTVMSMPVAAADEGLTIDSIDTSSLPEVSIVVTLPASMAGAQPAAEDFALVIGGTRTAFDVFAALTAPLEVVLLLDTSGSMAGEPIEMARQAAAAFVETMPASAAVTVISFGEGARVVAGPDDDTVAAIGGLVAAGETALYDAVIEGAARFVPDAATRRVMILLSDGGDTASAATLEEAASAAAASGAELHAVALATEETDAQALATITGGSVITASAADELSRLYAELSVALTGQYRLSFRADAAGATEVTIVIRGPDGFASASTVIDLPGGPASSVTTPGESPATVSPASITPPVPVVAAPPGALGRPWVMPAGVALVFIGSLVTLWLTLRQRDDRPPPIEIERRERTTSGVISSLADRARSLGDTFAARKSKSSSIDASLDRAGINLRPGEFVVVAATGIVVFTLGGLTLAGAPGAIVLGGAGALLPRTILRMLSERRQRAFADQLEGTLQIIAGSLRAGYGLTQSISTVAEESPSPTAEEFDRVVVENRLGRTIEDSMHAMAERMGNEDLGWVVEAIEIQHEVGGDLAEVLDTVTATIRDRNQIKRQVKALSAEGRISAIILLALPFVIAAFIAMISPDYLSELTSTTLGRLMLAVAAVLMLAGSAWIKRIVKVRF